MKRSTKTTLVAALFSLPLAMGIGIATPIAAQAAVTGTVCNRSKISPNWIWLSQISPANNTSWTTRVYPGQCGRAKEFVSGWPCYSDWGFRYKASNSYRMTTTGTLNLTCKNS